MKDVYLGDLIFLRGKRGAAIGARIRTRRWNDPLEQGDGHRLLVCRYRPRGVPKDRETWNSWMPRLGPSRELHAEYYGKRGPPIPWVEYRKRYLGEMREQRKTVAAVSAGVAAGETVTLLCSSACADPARCHRTLLKGLIIAMVPPPFDLSKPERAHRTQATNGPRRHHS
ncbi:MAG: DUF488 family protein [Myxococcota bacterium]|nr:DUF488 family protein [Myxococcota bacterium]